MRILFLDQFSDPGGAQLCLRDLLPGFLARGFDARLMAPGSGVLVQAAAELGIPADPLPLAAYTNGSKTVRDALRFGVDVPRAAAAIRSVVRGHAIDVIYVNGPRVLPAAAMAGRALVFHAHNILDKAYSRILASWALRKAGAGVVATSAYVAKPLAATAPVRVVHTGVRDYRPPARRTFTARPPTVGIIGRIAPEKGHADFLSAARMIGGARFLIYGTALYSAPGYERSIRQMAEGLPVEFRGWIGDVGAALNEIDVLTVPSRAKEAAGRVVVEALSAGTPVVAYPSGGIPELIDNGRTGILTGEATAESLADAILRLIADPERMAQLCAAGRREWERRFTLERYRREVCEFVSSTIAERCA